MTTNYDPAQKRGGLANPGNWTKYDNSNPEAVLPPVPFTSSVETPGAHGGYDRVERDLDGDVRYYRGDALHRTDGPAMTWEAGARAFFLDGAQVDEPDRDLSLSLAQVWPDGTQLWMGPEDGHNVRARVEGDGTTRFFRDGVPHRHGNPAVIRPDGTEEWWVGGVHHVDAFQPSGWPAPLPNRNDEYRSTMSVAKDVRADLKAVQAAGAIPAGLRLGVTSGNEFVNVTVRGMADADLYVPDEVYGRVHSKRAYTVAERLRRVAGAYNRAPGDSYTTYRVTVDFEDEAAAARRLERRWAGRG